jgi:predicted transcriptional regulator
MAEMLPSIRAEIARELVATHKMNQSEVSRILGVSQPAVSQYVRQLRGRGLLHSGLRSEIKSLCEKLVNGKVNGSDLEGEMYTICRSAVAMSV